jgi:hypothetical protein
MPVRFEDVWRAIRNKLPVDTWVTKMPASSGAHVPGTGSRPPLT